MKNQFELGVTKDYSMFKQAKNRNVNARKVARKKESIEKINLQQPIIVNRRFEVVDGQHRLEALKQLKRPVYYVVSRNWTTDEDTATMNNTQDSWGTPDWADFRISQGNETVKEAVELAHNYISLTNNKMTLNTALEMIAGKASTPIKTALRNNTYVYDNEIGHEVFQILMIIAQYPTAMNNPYNQKLVRAIKILKKDLGYINKKAIERMAKKNLISTYNNEQEMVRYIKKIYNQSLTK